MFRLILRQKLGRQNFWIDQVLTFAITLRKLYLKASTTEFLPVQVVHGFFRIMPVFKSAGDKRKQLRTDSENEETEKRGKW